MEAIKTDKLTKKYKNLTAVDSLDLLVEQGELFALLGVNDAGGGRVFSGNCADHSRDAGLLAV